MVDAQIVNANAGELRAYQVVYERAKKDNDQSSLEILNAIGSPPYEAARNMGQLNRIICRYEAKSSIPPPSSWIELAPAYNNEKDNQHRSDGDDNSFVYYTSIWISK